MTPQKPFASHTWVRPLAGALLIFLVAFLPLLVPSAAIHTDEEEHWRHRTTYFLSALSYRHFHDTAMTEHPGITVVALAGTAQLAWERWGGEPLALVDYIEVLRFPIKLVNALVVALGYLALRRAVGGTVAFWGALMWAASPYLRWHMRLVHIDGMTANFMMLSFVLLLLAFGAHRRVADDDAPQVSGWALVGAGVVGGLAALTRFSSFYLFGMAGLLALMNLWAYRRQMTVRLFAARIAAPVLVFALVIAATWTALYPAMWTNAAGVYAETVHGFNNAVSNHGTFYMGHPTQSPGATFYPVVLWFRMVPWVLAGVLLALIAAANGAMRDPWRVRLGVALYVGVYTLILTWQTKKIDRYALTLYPALHITAAFGWLWFVDVLRRRLPALSRAAVRAAAVLVFALVVLFPLRWIAIEYAFVNPVAGTQQAEQSLLIGGGEGLQGIAAFYNQLTDEQRCGKIFASSYSHVAEHYIPCGRAWSAWHLNPVVVENADYIINYVNFRQRDPSAQERLAGLTPIFTVRYGGIRYIEVYDGDTVREANAEWLLTMAENDPNPTEPPPESE